MPFFSGSATLTHRSKVPAKATREQSIAMLHDHNFYLHCNPHMSKIETLTTAVPEPAVPDGLKSQVVKETAVYQVTDIFQALPNGLWDSNVVSTYEFTNIANGVFARIKSPLSVALDSLWEIKGEAGELEIVETCTITCPRLLVGFVKTECEGNWPNIHGKMIERLEREVQT
ncbi:hypothetical protein B0T26DRAFT_745940 [Lasiosphaeria miniovina]|uniref:DUF7053 domain-containing protein n=1 Tax=Lasiosphaeria miniovina TaxID=1954250 RepID=A0AA40BGT4_9PEZI|nr:uncharacterized protein B0T26DRAFT_745940 [Lasiosphaeria miniovina]KAK0733966.1 hypothetical protein B0T26DRAFT_745940 [Lasiosphaeria miniovina]